MKILKLLPMLVLGVMLTACGHGFEGEYKIATNYGNAKMDKAMGSGGLMTIGADYVEQNGQRQMFDAIKVRDTKDGSYLVFVKGDKEDVWEIVDDKTLKHKTGFGKGMTLTRQ